MAASPKQISKIKFEMIVERSIYDEFIRWSARNGYSPNVLVEHFMRDTLAKGEGKTTTLAKERPSSWTNPQ